MSGAVAAAGVAVAAAWERRPADARRPVRARQVAGGLLVRWLGLEAAAHRLVVRPTLALAQVLARADDRAVDGVVRAIAAGTLALAGLSDRRLERGVDGAVRGIGSVSRRLGRLARRPQTGLVHQYYAQAVAVLAALVIVVLLVR